MSDPAGPDTAPTGIVALRTIGPVLIELPFTVTGDEQPRAGSIWPAADGTGWGRQTWNFDPGRRGWIIPANCHHGTIIELATAAVRRRRLVTARAWYAVAVTHDQHWLVCASPSGDPSVAARHAQAVTDQHRLAVIDRHR